MESDEAELERTIAFLQKLGSEEKSALAVRIEANPKKYELLFSTIGTVVAHSCGQLNKLYEMVISLELIERYPRDLYTIKHVNDGYGSDLIVTNKESGSIHLIEVKSSMTDKLNKKTKHIEYRTNWSFKLPQPELDAYREKPTPKGFAGLVLGVYAKQKNGYALLTARYNDDSLGSYFIDGAFMALYVVKAILRSKKGYSVNVGSVRCLSCDVYHRAQKLVEYGNLMPLLLEVVTNGIFRPDKEEYVTPEGWKDLFQDTPSDCKNKKNKQL